MLCVRISIRVRCTRSCDKFCQWLTTGRWFSPGRPVSSTSTTHLQDISEKMLKLALRTIKQINKNKDWYARNQNNVSEWRDMSSRGLLFQWAITMKRVGLQIGYLYNLLKYNLFLSCYSWTIGSFSDEQQSLSHSLSSKGVLISRSKHRYHGHRVCL